MLTLFAKEVIVQMIIGVQRFKTYFNFHNDFVFKWFIIVFQRCKDTAIFNAKILINFNKVLNFIITLKRILSRSNSVLYIRYIVYCLNVLMRLKRPKIAMEHIACNL